MINGYLFLPYGSRVQPVAVILGCQLDSMWSEPQSRIGGHTCDLDLETERQGF